MNENTDGEARRISCKTSRGISTHFAGDVWSSYRVDPGESTYSGFGTLLMQVTITARLPFLNC